MGSEPKYAGVRIKSPTSIEIDFYMPVNGKPTRVYRTIPDLTPTPENLAEVSDFRQRIITEIKNGTYDDATAFPPKSPAKFVSQPLQTTTRAQYITVGDWLTEWLGTKGDCKSSTTDDYRKIAENTLTPEIGHILLSELSFDHIAAWGQKQTCGNKRLKNVQSVLRAALDDALHHTPTPLISVNCLAGRCFKKKEKPQFDGEEAEKIDPFNEAEQTAILAACIDSQHRNLIQFAFWTGLRTSELVALRWSAIDLILGIIKVSRARTQAADEDELPKTSAGRREVKLLAPAIEALEAQRKITHSAKDRNAHVFLNPRTGEPWKGDQPIRQGMWQQIMRRANIDGVPVPYRYPYQTRHTYASMMLTAGEDVVWTSRQMGHTDYQMVAKRYGKWIKSATPDVGSKAVAMFGKARLSLVKG